MSVNPIYQLNEGHITEALDRIRVSIDYLEMSLSDHPLLISVTNFKSEIESVIDTLEDLYQTVGRFDNLTQIKNELGLAENYEIIK